MRPLLLLAVSVGSLASLGSLGGCGAADPGTPVPTPATSDGGSRGDAAIYGPPDAFLEPSLVLVNGLVTNTKLTDVRVCPDEAGDALPLPAGRPMPMANYPGIPRGGGADLGKLTTPALRVYKARDAMNETCSSLFSKGGIRLPLSGTLLGVHVVVLVDGPNDTVATKIIRIPLGAQPGDHLIAAQAAIGLGGSSGTDSGTVTFPAASAQVGTDAANATAGVQIPDTVSGVIQAKVGSIDFTQSLASIQTVSDPTTEPTAFYGVRTQYLFVLVGDPAKPYKPVAPQDFAGTELHFTAVPFVVEAKR